MELSKQYTRKAKKTESSIQANIPADIAEYLNIGEGDIVLYKVNSNGQILLEKKETVSEKMGVDEEFLSVLQEGMAEYNVALEDLMDR